MEIRHDARIPKHSNPNPTRGSRMNPLIGRNNSRRAFGNAAPQPARAVKLTYLGGLDNLGGGGDVHDGGHLDF